MAGDESIPASRKSNGASSLTTSPPAEKGSVAPDMSSNEADEPSSTPTADPVEESSPAEDTSGHVTGIRLALILFGLGLAVLLIALDSAVLATAIPVITNEFNSLPDVGWYGSVYLITICACQPIAGKILEQFSVKWSYLTFVLVFEIGSLICALAPSSAVLIVGRLIAGLGAAGLFSGALVIIAYIAPLQMRPAYTGLIMASYGVASIVGPVIGGALAQYSTWRWCFYINLPPGGVTIGLLLFGLRIPPQDRGTFVDKLKKLDILGFLLFSPAVTMLLIALQWGGNKYAWNSSTIIGLFCGAGVMLIIFAGWQWHLKDEASIPPAVIGQRSVGLGALSAVLANGGINAINYWLPIWFQAVLGSTPTISGVQFIPTILANIIISIVGGGAVTKFGYYNPFLIVGMAFSAIAAGLFTTFQPDSTRGEWIGYQVIAGLGHGLVIQMPVIAVQAVLPLPKIAAGTTLLIFSQFFGGAVFLAIAQNIFQSQLLASIPRDAPGVNATAVLLDGATNFRKSVSDAQLPGVLHAYNTSIVDVFWLATAGAIVAFVASLGMEWKSVKPPETAAAPDNEKEAEGATDAAEA